MAIAMANDKKSEIGELATFVALAFLVYEFGTPYLNHIIDKIDMWRQAAHAVPMASYRQSAKPLNYRDALLDEYADGSLLEAAGQVFQVESPHEIRIFMEGRIPGRTTDHTIKLYFSRNTKFMSGDMIRVYGRYDGVQTGQGLLGQTLKDPVIEVDHAVMIKAAH